MQGYNMAKVHYPYFNYILKELELGNLSLEKSFGHHVHWGYWENPLEAKCGDNDFYLAAENLTQKLCSLGQIANGQAVLDAGCGFGGTTSFLNKNYTDMHLTGLNIDERQLVRARKLVQALPNNKIEFIEGDACALPFAENQFDRILAVECIFHFPSREQFFAEALRVLKPGGTVTFCDFVSSPIFYPTCKMFAFPLFNKLNFLGKCTIITLNKYKKLAEQFGFTMKMHDITANTIPTYTYLRYLRKRSGLGLFYKVNAGPCITLMKMAAEYRLLTYPIISFTKPQNSEESVTKSSLVSPEL